MRKELNDMYDRLLVRANNNYEEPFFYSIVHSLIKDDWDKARVSDPDLLIWAIDGKYKSE